MRNRETRRASWRAYYWRHKAERRAYTSRPEVKARRHIRARAWRARPEIQARRRRYLADPEVRFRRKLCRIAVEIERLDGIDRAETLQSWGIGSP